MSSASQLLFGNLQGREMTPFIPPSYTSTILEDGAQFYYTLSAAQTSYTDEVGSGFNLDTVTGITSNATPLREGNSGSINLTNSADSYAASSSAPALALVGRSAYTIAGWWKAPVADPGTIDTGHLFGFSYDNLSNYFVGIEINAGTGLRALNRPTTNSGANFAEANMSAYFDNNPHYFALVRDGASLYLFADGVQIGVGVVDDIPLTEAPFEVGGRDFAVRRSEAIVSDVAFFPTALTAAQLLNHYSFAA